MRFEETIASRCRYGETAAPLMAGARILWEDSEEDYSGHARVLAEKAGQYLLLEWSYGSCSGCDEWEDRDLSEEQIRQEMQRTMGVLPTKAHLEGYAVGLRKNQENYEDKDRARLIAAIDAELA